MQEIYITKFDKLGEKLITALQEGCAEWAPGIEIIDVSIFPCRQITIKIGQSLQAKDP